MISSSWWIYVYFSFSTGDLYNEAAEAAMAAMKGKLSNKFFMLAEECYGEMDEDWEKSCENKKQKAKTIFISWEQIGDVEVAEDWFLNKQVETSQGFLLLMTLVTVVLVLLFVCYIVLKLF